jgi:hypothetical protein
MQKRKNPFSLLAKRVSRALAVFVYRSVVHRTGGARKLTIKSALEGKIPAKPGCCQSPLRQEISPSCDNSWSLAGDTLSGLLKR